MDDYQTICDKCGKHTWYEQEQQCHCEYPKVKTCKSCGHSKTIEPIKMVRCKGTLKKIDNTDLNPSFTPYYKTQERIEVKFSYGEVKRGRIGKTTGWKPSYLLMLTTRSIGIPYLIGKDDKIIEVIN